MKTLKLIFTQGVDLLFAGVTLGLLIWHLVNSDKNFTLFLWVVFGYVVNVIRNKVIIAGKM
jgi:hypothetical protein